MLFSFMHLPLWWLTFILKMLNMCKSSTLKCSLIWSSLAHSCVEEAQATYCSNHEFMRGSQSEQSWLDGFFQTEYEQRGLHQGTDMMSRR